VPKHRQAPSVDTAFRFLTDSFKSESWKNGDRLPSLARLAHLAKVSRNSMWKAMLRAQKEKMVVVTRGGFIIAGNGRTKDAMQLECKERAGAWQMTRARIEQDIINGTFSETGVLPRTKELQITYGVCSATLQKILRSLATAGVVVLYNRLYRLPHAKPHRTRRSVVFISSRINDAVQDPKDFRAQKMVDTLESFGARHGFTVDFVDLDAIDPVSAAGRSKGDDATIGHIVNLPWFSGEEHERRVYEIIAGISSQKRPLAILDSSGELTLSHVAGPADRMRVFTIASWLAGRQVADHLLGLGHTRIAYISLIHDYAWSKRRLSGIVKRFKEAGFPDGVVPIVIDNVEQTLREGLQIGSFPPEDNERILAIQSPREQLGYLRKYYEGVKGAPGWSDELIESIRKDIAALLRLDQKDIKSDIVTHMRETAMERMTARRNDSLITPLFERALGDAGITAWVAANDGMAQSALRYLSSKHVRVPRDVSVVGFDNMPKSFEMKLTTYDFNMSGIIHNMLWFIQHYDERKNTRFYDPMEVAGMVITRGTTGRAQPNP
jgi:DNA-binding LacI/PurR family transcriptional regulator/DNA-binding transcriptional regulator YhcF (GntR family)